MLGLKFKLITATVLASALPLAGYFYSEYSSTKNDILAAVKDDLISTATNSSNKFERWMETSRASLETLAGVPDFEEMTRAEDKLATKNRMRWIVESVPWVRTSFYANLLGVQVVRSNNENLVNIVDREYFQVAKAGQFGAQLVVTRTAGIASMIIGSPVYGSGESSKVKKGVLGYTSDCLPISKEIVADPIYKSGFKFILNPEGYLVAHHDLKLNTVVDGHLPVYESHPLWMKRPSKSGEASEPTFFNYNGVDYLGTLVKDKYGFYVASVLPVEEFEELLSPYQWRAVIFLSGALGVAFLLAYVLSGSIVNPIKKMSKVADEIANGNFQDEHLMEWSKAQDETGELAQAVLALSNSVKIATQQLK